MSYLPRLEYFRHTSAWLLYSEWEQVLPLGYNHQYIFFNNLILYKKFIKKKKKLNLAVAYVWDFPDNKHNGVLYG